MGAYEDKNVNKLIIKKITKKEFSYSKKNYFSKSDNYLIRIPSMWWIIRYLCGPCAFSS